MKRLTAILGTLLLTSIITAQPFEPVPYDKKWHMGAGTLAGAWGTFAGNSLGWTAEQSALFGVASSVVAGIGKELMDVGERWIFKVNNRFDTMDLAATALGGVIGAGLSYAALKIFKKKIIAIADSQFICIGIIMNIDAKPRN